MIGNIIDRNLKICPIDSYKQMLSVKACVEVCTNKTQGECPRSPVYMDYLGLVASGCRTIYDNVHLPEYNLLVEVQRKWGRIIKIWLKELCIRHAKGVLC